MLDSAYPVPSPPTSFVGRSAERSLLLDLLSRRDEVRLITVTGSGGVGKTRLAVEVVRALDRNYSDGIWYIDLATITNAAEIAPRLADTLGVEPRPGSDVLDAVGQFIAKRELLIIFDNCEHVVDDLAIVLNVLLLRTLHLHVLCTSREAIHLPGEQRIAVGPMTSPPAVANGGDVYSLYNADAIKLFGERAAAVAPDFTLNATNIHDVAAICHAVDGIPLAVELAAAQIRVFTPREIAQRLETDLAFLTNGRAGASRHKTLDAAIAWSEQLLTAEEQRLFHRFSLFAQSATLAAIESVCADADLPRTAILGLLTRLVDKSLVMTRPAGDQMRFGMLGTIQRFARQRLHARGEWQTVARRHALWVWDLAHEGSGAIYTRDSMHWVRRVEVEDQNVRQAIHYGIEFDPTLATEIISNLGWYWLWRNYMADALAWTHAIMAQPAAAESAHIRGRLLFITAMGYAWTSDFEGACRTLEDARALAIAADDREIIPRIQQYYAVSAIYAGRLNLAETILDEIDVQRHSSIGALPAVGQFTLRGIIARERGNPAKALEIMEEGLRQLREFGEPFLMSNHLFELARTYQLQGNARRAEELFRECHELTLRTQNAPLLTRSFFVLAENSQADSNLREALDWFEAGLEHLHGQGEEPSAATLMSLAYVAGVACMWPLCTSLYSAAGIPWPLEKALSATVEAPYRRQIENACLVLGEVDFARARREGNYWSIADALKHGIEVLRSSLVAGQRAAHPELQMRMLGDGQVLLDDKPLEMADWKYAVARDLLFYLVTTGERTREQIVADFWPDVDAARARNRLNVTIHFLRKALGARRWIVFENNRYRFDPVGNYSSDVDDFYSATALAERIAATQPEQAIASLTYATSLVRGPFLSDVTEGAWHQGLRIVMHRDYQATLLRLADLQINTGMAQNAVYTISLALQTEPFAEATYRTLMRAHLQRHDLVQVMQVYRHLSELLDEEFGAAPSLETVATYEDIVNELRSQQSNGG